MGEKHGLGSLLSMGIDIGQIEFIISISKIIRVLRFRVLRVHKN